MRSAECAQCKVCAVQIVHSAKCAQCRLCTVQSVTPSGALVVSTLFPSGAQVLSIQFPSEVKLSPSRPKWYPSGCQDVAKWCQVVAIYVTMWPQDVLSDCI